MPVGGTQRGSNPRGLHVNILSPLSLALRLCCLPRDPFMLALPHRTACPSSSATSEFLLLPCASLPWPTKGALLEDIITVGLGRYAHPHTWMQQTSFGARPLAWGCSFHGQRSYAHFSPPDVCIDPWTRTSTGTVEYRTKSLKSVSLLYPSSSRLLAAAWLASHRQDMIALSFGRHCRTESRILC